MNGFLNEILFKIYLVEYPYEAPQREENIQPSPLHSVETITGLAKTMKLNANKTIDGQGCLFKYLFIHMKKI